MIHYSCPKCGEALESPDSLAGAAEVCPICRAPCRVPIAKPRRPTKLFVSVAILFVLIILCTGTFFLLRSKGHPNASDSGNGGLDKMAALFLANLRTELSTPQVMDDLNVQYMVPDTYSLNIKNADQGGALSAATLTIEMPTVITPTHVVVKNTPVAHTTFSFIFRLSLKGGQWGLDGESMAFQNSQNQTEEMGVPDELASRIRSAFDNAQAGAVASPSTTNQ